MFVPYAYVSIKSLDCISLSLFEFKTILLICSIETFLSLLNLCCVLILNFCFLRILYVFFCNKGNYLHQFYFFLDNLFYYQLSSFRTAFIILKFKFSFYDTLFSAFCFFYLHYHHLLSNYKFLILIQQSLS